MSWPRGERFWFFLVRCVEEIKSRIPTWRRRPLYRFPPDGIADEQTELQTKVRFSNQIWGNQPIFIPPSVFFFHSSVCIFPVCIFPVCILPVCIFPSGFTGKGVEIRVRHSQGQASRRQTWKSRPKRSSESGCSPRRSTGQRSRPTRPNSPDRRNRIIHRHRHPHRYCNLPPPRSRTGRRRNQSLRNRSHYRRHHRSLFGNLRPQGFAEGRRRIRRCPRWPDL